MASDERRRYTLGQMIAVVGLVGLVAVYLANRDLSGTLRVVLVVLALIFLNIFMFSNSALNQIMARHCPGCGSWTMARFAIHSFGDRYYRCAKCGVRARRIAYGWEDASAPEFDQYYARKRPENPWTAPPGVEDEDLIYSKTHVNLLLNKQRRNPNAPDQWTARPGDTEGG